MPGPAALCPCWSGSQHWVICGCFPLALALERRWESGVRNGKRELANKKRTPFLVFWVFFFFLKLPQISKGNRGSFMKNN